MYLHGLAGDIAAKHKGMESLIASDIIQYLPQAFLQLEKQTMRMKTATALIAALTLVSSNAKAQENSITYYLPQTALQMRLSVEKTEYTPGQFAAYAKRYMKKQNVPQPSPNLLSAARHQDNDHCSA